MPYKIKIEGIDYPVEYDMKRYTDGIRNYQRHVIYYNNMELLGQSLEEVVELCKEYILTKMKGGQRQHATINQRCSQDLCSKSD